MTDEPTIPAVMATSVHVEGTTILITQAVPCQDDAEISLPVFAIDLLIASLIKAKAQALAVSDG